VADISSVEAMASVEVPHFIGALVVMALLGVFGIGLAFPYLSDI